MKAFFKKLLKGLMYTLAGFVILLAIGVGLLRLFLPRLPEYQEQIKVWASDAVGVRVEFSAMDARWGLNGPELEFIDAELLRPDDGSRIIAAEEVSVSVALLRLIAERTVAIDRILVRDSQIEIRRLDDGSFWAQGGTVDDLIATFGKQQVPAGGEIEFVGRDIEILFSNPGDSRPSPFDVRSVSVLRDDQRVGVDADIGLPDTIGERLEVSATYVLNLPEEERYWDVDVELDSLLLAGASGLVGDSRFDVTGGEGDAELSFALSVDGITSAAAAVEFTGITYAGVDAFSLVTDIEYRRDPDGWLLAANRVRLETSEGRWEDTDFRIDAGLGENGTIDLVDIQSGYLRLDDYPLVTPFLPEDLKQPVRTLAPRGEVDELDVTLSNLSGDTLRYGLSANFSGIGFNELDAWPGVRNFSGSVRADLAGGRVELQSTDATLFLSGYIAEPIDLTRASGTVIWRRSGDQTTVLSDNIVVQNAEIDSQTNVQLTIDGDSSPVIDLASRWSLTDLGSAKRYIPERVLDPNLYRWFQQALLSGRIDDGRTLLNGPLDKYPFDGGEGRFLLEATVEDSLFRYLPKWPVLELESLEVVLENTRLTTERNFSTTEGRIVENAQVSIADLRDPVLRIEGGTRGDMPSLIQFSKNSPINDMLGGQLENVEVSGTAETTLSLTVPLKSSKDFEVTVGVRPVDATLRINGLAPEITNINGSVTIERRDIRSENLVAEFLGRPVTIALAKASPDMEGYDTVATVKGRLDADALADGFNLGVKEFFDGETNYTATLLFPSNRAEPKLPFSIGLASDLSGIEVGLPAPFGKPADQAEPLNGSIEFLEQGSRIRTTGQTRLMAWNLHFLKDAAWDFDRGQLALGGTARAESPDVRGLRITGEISRFDFDEWQNLPGEAGDAPNIVERIRSADVMIDDFRVLGQAYADQRVQLDRSARDWEIQLAGELASGSIQLPYEFTPEATIVLDMETLILPGDGEDEVGGEPVDPRTLPAITLRAGEFGLGTRRFGAVEADVQRTEEGLVADRIVANDPSFEIFANGGWVADDDEPAGSRTFLVGGLRSTNIKATMDRLDYQPGIEGEDLSVIMDIGWSGSPATDILSTLSGSVEVSVGPGQLDDVDPGAGRVFGLLSIVALPRRLSLDFSDVFQKGFGFDEITGNFRIENGDAYTCDLSLEGPAAAIGIVGRAGLASRDYEQSAIVSANFGNSLPIIGAVAAGPQAAAALLIFSQIFKKPLQDLSQVYYSIDGSFESPSFEGTDAAAFAEAGRLANCLNGADQG